MQTNNYMDDTDNSPHDNQTSQSTVSSPPTNTAGSPTITCDGAYVEIADFLRAVMVKIGDVVKRKGKTIKQAMEGAFLIMFPDGAVHPRLQAGDCNIITYCLTISSPWLIKECGFSPTSGFNIIPHAQLRGKESTETLCSVLQFCTRDFPSALSDIPSETGKMYKKN